jgi:hypothetical protein
MFYMPQSGTLDKAVSDVYYHCGVTGYWIQRRWKARSESRLTRMLADHIFGGWKKRLVAQRRRKKSARDMKLLLKETVRGGQVRISSYFRHLMLSVVTVSMEVLCSVP